MYCALDKTLSYISNKSGSYCTFVVVARREKRKNTWCKRQRCVSTKQCLSVGRYMRYLAKKSVHSSVRTTATCPLEDST